MTVWFCMSWESCSWSGGGEGLSHIHEDLDSGFRVIQMIPKDVVYKNMEPFLKGYGIWFGCSVVTGFGLALYFSRRRYRSFQWLMENNEELEEEATGCGRRNAYMSF